MFNLSLTACSFHFRERNSKGNDKVISINSPIFIGKNENREISFNNVSELFAAFFLNYRNMYIDGIKQQSFRCEYSLSNRVENDAFVMIYVKIHSGSYGSSSEIIDGKTQETYYSKKASDIDVKPFYLMIVLPKDNDQVTVQKGMFIFQNVGQYGIKTITTKLMRDFFATNFNLTMNCNTIAPELFIKKVVKRDSIRKIIMIKNITSSDSSDNINIGYGTEVRELSKLSFSEKTWDKIMDGIRGFSGGRYNLFEFVDGGKYDDLKVEVDIGDRKRKISLHNIENLSIIEGIPDKIRMADGHPNLQALIEHFSQVAAEYLQEMVLEIA